MSQKTFPTLAFVAPVMLQQNSASPLTYVLIVIAILLLVVFVWLLLVEQQRERMKANAQRKAEVEPVEIPGSAVVTEPPPPAPPIEAISPAEVVGTASAAAAAAAPATKGPMLATPLVEDDLEIIEGIGPKIAGILKTAGVTSFAQLAAMEPARISEILLAGGIRLVDPHSWPEQARLAAAGDKIGLKALQDRLKGGR